ncbi:MAG: D-alanyl-D-alanine carboxypeptidase [Nitrospirae bacterium YQR-1]
MGKRVTFILWFLRILFIVTLVCSMSSFACAKDITARSAVIMDTDTDRVLYAKNPLLKQPPASTAKLVTAMVVLDNLDIRDVTTISANASELSGSTVELREGDRYYIGDLLHIMLMKSVNGASVALAEAVSGSEGAFVNLMNKKVKKIGAGNTRYINSHGLPGEGQYITAYDLAIVMRESLQYHVIRDIINKKTKTVVSIDGTTASLINTNKLLWKDEDLLGGKTGYTKAARHCLAFAAERGENTYVAAVLGDTQRSNLWRSAETVLNKGYDISESHTKPEIHFSNGKGGDLNKITVKSRNHYSKKSKGHYEAKVVSKHTERAYRGKKAEVVKIAKSGSPNHGTGKIASAKSQKKLIAKAHNNRSSKGALKRAKLTAKSSYGKSKILKSDSGGNTKHAKKVEPCKIVKNSRKNKICKDSGKVYDVAFTDPKNKPVAY